LPGKRTTTIPRTHGKRTRDRNMSEPDIYWILDKWLGRHPAVRAASRKRLAIQKAVLAHT
jgi:hypothetical protein